MQHDVVWANDLVPSTNQLGIHLIDRREGAVGELTDPSVTEVGVGRDVVDLVEIELGILPHDRLHPVAGYRFGFVSIRRVARRQLGDPACAQTRGCKGDASANYRIAVAHKVLLHCRTIGGPRNRTRCRHKSTGTNYRINDFGHGTRLRSP